MGERFLSQTGRPAGLALTTEDRKVKMFLAKTTPAAMVVDASAGSPAVRRAGLTVETERFQLAPI